MGPRSKSKAGGGGGAEHPARFGRSWRSIGAIGRFDATELGFGKSQVGWACWNRQSWLRGMKSDDGPDSSPSPYSVKSTSGWLPTLGLRAPPTSVWIPPDLGL